MKAPIDPEFGTLLPEGTTGHLATGDDQPRIAGGIVEVDGVPMRARSVRMSEDMIADLDTREHPGGFSGIVREAVTEWLERHGGQQAEVDDARRAVATLARLVDRMTHAA